jgi:hypothetical protein
MTAVASSIRGYNELVQAILWVLLGEAEASPDEVSPIPNGLSRIAVEHRWRHLEAHFTFDHITSLHWLPPHTPFVVSGRGPLDGIYLSRGASMRSLGEGGGFTDVTGILVRELELGPLL